MVDAERALGERLGVELADPTLLDLALVHASYASENQVESNQRLEFLGDAVLDLVVAEVLYLTHPELGEGDMSKARIALVNETVLAEIARELDLGAALRLGRGAEADSDREKASILSDAMEAVIGAVYLDGGIDAARRFILSRLGHRLEAAATHPGAEDHKTLVQEWSQATRHLAPSYTIESSGPQHDPRFVATLRVGDEVLGIGEGRSKKAAEQDAARAAWGVVGRA